MSIYNKNGSTLLNAYKYDSSSVVAAYDVSGEQVYPDAVVDYNTFNIITMWNTNRGSNQGFGIKDDKVFWIVKSGDATIPSSMYVYNLSDGSQALSTDHITCYAGHGNNISFAPAGNTLIATPAYPPSRVYINSFAGAEYTMTLEKTLVLNDGSTDCDACYDPDNVNIMYSVGHTDNSSNPSAPYRISKWNLSNLTDNQDDTFTPELLSSVLTPQPSNTYFFQGCAFHDGLLWVLNGYTGASRTLVFGINVTTGAVEYTLDCDSTTEPEGICWYPDNVSAGGYALYVGWQGSLLKKLVFSEV